MRAAIALVLALAVPAVAAGPVEFDVPASFSGDWSLAGVSRVLVVVPPATGASVVFDVADASGPATNRTFTVATAHEPTAGRYDAPVPSPEAVSQVEGLTAIQAGGTRWGSIYLEGDIQVVVKGGAELQAKPDGLGLEAFMGNLDRGFHARMRPLPDREPYVLMPEGAEFQVHASRLTRIEWYGVRAECQSACPGGGESASRTDLPLGASMSVVTRTFIELETATKASGAGRGAFLLAGGPALTVALTGDVRLPLALAGPCASCVQADNETLAAIGNVTLAGVRDMGGGRMVADFTADGALVRLDEAPGVPVGTVAVVAGAATVAVGAAVAVVWKVVAALFSRHVPDPLKSPRRAALYRAVVANPGATFRQVAAAAGLAAGAARHHLAVLERAGLVVARPHGSTLRFFENHGKYDGAWREVVMLRDPEMRTLVEWLRLKPGMTQVGVVAAMQERHGWSRSATQKRLSKLVHGGFLTTERKGRTTLYWSLEPTPA